MHIKQIQAYHSKNVTENLWQIKKNSRVNIHVTVTDFGFSLTFQVPVPFLIMLLVQFVMIIIDRALFLRKNVFGKFIFQIFLVILVHVWMFFILPLSTDRWVTLCDAQF